MLGVLKKAAKTLISGDHTPCYILSEAPLVLVAYSDDFYRQRSQIRERLSQRYPSQNAQVLFQLGWHVETAQRLAEVNVQLQPLLTLFPECQFTFLTNSETERDRILSLDAGVDALFCHQNAFLDPYRYAIYTRQKRYDAIYLARITPFKRHELAAEVKSLKLIGAYKPEEVEHYQKIRKLLAHASYQQKVMSFRVSRAMAEAHVGLCLSAEEGAMFVSTEYLLSGLTVVTTANMGGRNHLMPEQFMLQVEDTPEAVAEGVEQMKARAADPEQIRNSTLALMQTHRNILIDYLNKIAVAQQLPAFNGPLPHKLNLRTRVPLLQRKRML